MANNHATPLPGPPPPPPTRYRRQWRINLLGPIQLGHHTPDDPARPWKYTRTPELITWLLLHPNGATRDTLTDALYDGTPVEPQRLNQLTSDARKAIGRALPTATTGRYRLDLDHVKSDLLDYAALDTAARAMDPGPEQTAVRLQALTHIRGPLFGGTDWQWAKPDTAELAGRIEQTALDTARTALAAADPWSAVTACRAANLIDTGHWQLLETWGQAALLTEDAAAIAVAWAALSRWADPDDPAGGIFDRLTAARTGRW